MLRISFIKYREQINLKRTDLKLSENREINAKFRKMLETEKVQILRHLIFHLIIYASQINKIRNVCTIFKMFMKTVQNLSELIFRIVTSS